MRGKRRVFYGNTPPERGAMPDPYGPTGPNYHERNQLTEVEIAPGVMLVSAGEPIKRVGPQPKPLPAALVTDEPAPAANGAPPAAPLGKPKEPLRAKNWRDDYGLLKQP